MSDLGFDIDREHEARRSSNQSPGCWKPTLSASTWRPRTGILLWPDHCIQGSLGRDGFASVLI